MANGGSGVVQVWTKPFSQVGHPFDLVSCPAALEKTKKKPPTKYKVDKNHVIVSRLEPMPCWCLGYPNGCGKILKYSARQQHLAKEKMKRLQGEILLSCSAENAC